MCEVSEKHIHWYWRYSSGHTNLGWTDAQTDGVQITIPHKIIFLVIWEHEYGSMKRFINNGKPEKVNKIIWEPEKAKTIIGSLKRLIK